MSYPRPKEPMSYCRIASDSDVYAYHSGKDFVIMVATTREARWGYVAVIGLPHDGEIFTEYSLESFEKRLMDLRDGGYRVPQSVFDRIRRERNEGR